MLRGMLNRALSGGRAGGLGRRPVGGRPTAAGTGSPMGGAAGGRSQDEAIGRGVRSLLRRFR